MSWDRVERLIGAENLQKLAHKRVGIIGLGSGGGFVAQTLAMSGVGKFVLVDDDVLEEANIVRHIADQRDIGRNKAQVVADLLRQRNPALELDVRIGRIEQHMDALDHLDILVVAVDGEGTKYVINEAALARNLVAVYAGVYERGEGGDVVVIRPYQGPCYACWAAELREGLALAGTTGELDYGMIGPEGTLEAEPGLWLHVVRVASVQADLVLNELLTGTPVHYTAPGNTLILANRALEIVDGQVTPPHTALWAEIERDPECLVCGQKMQQEIGDAQQAEGLSLLDLASSSGIVFDDQESLENRGE